MNWKDFFYFSKGERAAIILLLFIISFSLLFQWLKNDSGKEKAQFYPVTIYTPSAPAPPHTGYPVAPETKERVETKKEIKNKPSTPAATGNRATERFIPANKFPQGTVVELNTADTSTLKRVPGIGSTFAKRIVGYRNLLGGYHSVQQLREVYGIDEERYSQLEIWFCVNPAIVRRLPLNLISADSLPRHPYLNYPQAKAIRQLRRQKGKLSGWHHLELLEEFTEKDQKRLLPYLSFE